MTKFGFHSVSLEIRVHFSEPLCITYFKLQCTT